MLDVLRRGCVVETRAAVSFMARLADLGTTPSATTAPQNAILLLSASLIVVCALEWGQLKLSCTSLGRGSKTSELALK
jgi:hypothetical protein